MSTLKKDVTHTTVYILRFKVKVYFLSIFVVSSQLSQNFFPPFLLQFMFYSSGMLHIIHVSFLLAMIAFLQ